MYNAVTGFALVVICLSDGATTGPARLRLQINPNLPLHVHDANVLHDVVEVWHQVPADFRSLSVLVLDNYENSARAVRIEKQIKICQENAIPVVPEVSRAGTTNETINPTWLNGIFKEYSKVVGVDFTCYAPEQLNTDLMREYLEVCGRNGGYFFYNMNCKGTTYPEHFEKMLADAKLVATMRKYRENIVVNYYTGGFEGTLTEAQKAQSLEKLKQMLADGLIGRIGYLYREIGAADVERERANGCMAFGAMVWQVRDDYWKALGVPAAEPTPLRFKFDSKKPMHIQGCNVLRDIKSAWQKIPADIRPITILELDNFDNAARAECFEDYFVECEKNGIPVMPEIMRYGGRNSSINSIWLDSMFKKYSMIVAIAFDCNEVAQLDTAVMREYLEVCGQNGAYFFFNMENKALTLPEHLDRMLADQQLVAAMKRYHKNIVVNYFGGGMRGTPTETQKAENLKKLKQMRADGLIGEIGYYHAWIRGTDVDRERVTGCTIFGGNELQETRNADYWESLRKILYGSSRRAGQPGAVIREAKYMRLPGVKDGYVDCNSPLHWDGATMYIFSSVHIPYRASGPDLFNLQGPSAKTSFDNAVSPYNGGRGRWIESTYKDADGALYGWYHIELEKGKYHNHIDELGRSGVCPGNWLTIPLVGAAISTNNGMNWRDMGIILKAPEDSLYCNTANKFFAGGNGDFSVILDQNKKYFYFFISTYNKDIKEQGVSVARMAYADRDNPVGRAFKWHKGGWNEPGIGGHVTPIFPAKISWHEPMAEVFWGPSVHWNTYLKQYVILLNRAKNGNFSQEGIYMTFNPDLSRPGEWSEPVKILDADQLEASKWYPQVVGTNAEARETDKLAGRVARLFVAGASNWEIVFGVSDHKMEVPDGD